MKKLSVLIIVMSISLIGFSQSKKSNNLVNFDSLKSPSLKLFLHSDTLEIFDYRTIRFIKIGENVYEIKSPTIEKVELFPTGIFISPNNGMRFFNSTDTTIIAPVLINTKVDEKIKTK